ncbi:RND family efflux transporter, MFP subunit [Desulfuromonas soudanensis]|uniref:RND family efflux transporter, MFP subunit n=1 Tax=Desulfuromonas soudanensis TaxID=1603606 RepID=A0A0M4D0D0_9BACT|nr:efflux RND transporter periplasmic adaptor subunit [Desulfuromonas soudanensis]ALC15301.1 RND family efflux transporter, MFP subunit [Desulfuromonas soudanensis]
MSTKSKLIKIGLPLIIIAAGIVGMRVLVLSRPVPQKEVRENPGALVEVFTVAEGPKVVEVVGTGTVQPSREVAITPQVSGAVVSLSPRLVPGGFFRKGEELLRIEEIDYRLAVDRARAALAKAEVELATVQGQGRIARQEWDRLALGDGEEPNPLVLYQPQEKNARAGVASAQAALSQAELDLQRTRLVAPFNGRIRSEQVELGQYLRAGSAVVQFAGTDAAEVLVPLPLEELPWLKVPGPGRTGNGSPALIRGAVDGSRWTGRVVRSLGEVDALGRMARLVVEVEDPYGLQSAEAGPALEVGMFVTVTLQGKELPKALVIPRRALRDAGTVWVADSQNLLRLRKVEVLRLEEQQALIGAGLEAGERVVLTPLAGAAEGMKLRIVAGKARS